MCPAPLSPKGRGERNQELLMRHGCRLLMAVAFAALVGCTIPRRSAVLEEQARFRESQYRDALGELMRTDTRKDAPAAEKSSPGQGAVVSSQPLVHYITFGRLTGGLDRDGVVGDEVLSVVVVPFDHFAKVIQSPGTLRITAEQMAPEGAAKALGEWVVPEEKLPAAWKQGLLDGGYHFEFAWQTPPSREQVRVVACFTTADGRSYEAAKEVKVRLAGAAASATSVEPIVRVGHQAIAIGQPTPLNRETFAPPPVAPPPLAP